MKINHQYKFLLVIFSLFLFVSCNKKAAETVTEEEHHDETGVVELTPMQVKSAQIVFGIFEKKNLSEVITANGYTKLPPQNQADVSVFLGGIIKTIAVIEGQFVKKGQTLATFQSMEFNNIRLAKAKLTEELQQAKVSKDFLELEFARQKELSDENVTAKKTFQKINTELETIKNKIKNTENQIIILDQNLSLGGNDNASILSIVAPISGYITEVKVKIGSSISANNTLFSIVDNSKMHVDLLVYEKDLFRIKVGQSVRFVLTNQGNQEIIGRIFSVGKAFQNESKSVAVHADINNSTIGLIPGMYVNALIDIGKNDVETLPIDAIAKAEGKEFIFIQEEHDEEPKSKGQEVDTGVHFKRIEVKTGTTQLGFVQVTPLQEIPAGAKIVAKGAYYLQSTMSNSEGGDEHNH
ncbi:MULTISPECIES: efflux RND transporter periplasmic adaptor subunit [Leadbetterellaceae]|jgi:cobalt-zinc-cadmium efflux system membrane fusion protein|uniref:Efflux RND transporter periplasmic adaptor subunit n=1 Tax=Lacihabitans soyangensis TaxID=869394 RepID=A0AAE3GYE6_9BACT|nr:efflux RND transporter periplasmic adaptor subunit [Lacihabitans soyangensis]MCP9761492.1 efflux RND transporter periplasmic adaptor subunit [Lacihabitans soyangensis]